MIKQWERRAKKKFYLITASLLVLILSGGIYAYTYITAVGTINTAAPTGDIASVNATPTQPDWNSVTDNLSENTTCGEVPADDLFEITPNPAYTGDLLADVHLANVGSLIKAYQYLNMKVYIEGSVSANETPNYQLLTLQNGQTTFSLLGLIPTSGTWTQTSQADFESGTLNQVDTITSPGDVILDTLIDNVTDTFGDTSKIATSANVTVSGGQVKLTIAASGTVTLRPNANGDLTEFEDLLGAPTHWEAVDEVVADDATTHVGSDVAGRTDLFQLTDSGLAAATPINSVTVYEWVRREGRNTDDWQIIIKSGTTPAYSTTFSDEGKTWVYRSSQWTTDPNTGEAWTVAAVDALQAGAYTVTGVDVSQVYVEVDYTVYDSPGTLTSVNLLSGETVKSIDSFYYDASAIPSGTSLKVQFSIDNTTWYNSAGTPGGWDTLSQGTDNISLAGLGWSGPNFYYHMEFTSDGSDTPVLDEISIIFSTYYSSGDLTSSTFDAGSDLAWDWQNITFTIDEPSATDIKFQLRSSATEGGLSSATWYGPTGTGDYYTTSGTAINSVHDGDRWIQYKAYFSGPGLSTPTLSDVSITYTAPTESYTVEIIGGGYCLISDNTSEWGSGWTVTPEFYAEATQR